MYVHCWIMLNPRIVGQSFQHNNVASHWNKSSRFIYASISCCVINNAVKTSIIVGCTKGVIFGIVVLKLLIDQPAYEVTDMIYLRLGN